MARPVLVFSISGGWRHPCTLGLQPVPPLLPYVVSTGPDPCRAAGSGCLLSSRLSPENLWRPQWSADKVDLPCTALFKVCQQPPVFLRLRTGCPLHQLRPLRSPDVCSPSAPRVSLGHGAGVCGCVPGSEPFVTRIVPLRGRFPRPTYRAGQALSLCGKGPGSPRADLQMVLTSCRFTRHLVWGIFFPG